MKVNYKNKKLIILIAVLVSVGVGVFITRSPKQSEGCSPDGHQTRHPAPLSHRTYCLKSFSKQGYKPGQSASFAFSIVDIKGNTLKQFETVHEKIMHFIVVRKDLAEFQHLHPNFDEVTGVFSQNELSLPSNGEYRVFADFTPKGSPQNLPVTVYSDINSGNVAMYKPESIGGYENIKTFQGHQFEIIKKPQSIAPQAQATLVYKIENNGQQVTDLRNYLGSLGHVVVIREGDLQFIHAHPETKATQNGTVEFAVTFPQAGNYKLFGQFQRNSQVITTDFVVPVGGTNQNSNPDSVKHPAGHQQ